MSILLAACGAQGGSRDFVTGRSQGPDGGYSSPEDVYLVIDTSGSMSEQVRTLSGRSQPKIDVAVDATRNLLRQLRDTRVALRTYPQSGMCDSGRLWFGFSSSGDSKVEESLNRLTPDGLTPTAETLTAVAADIRNYGRPATVVLISDGLSNCADPCEAARRLSQTTDWRVITVGFDLGDSGSDELRCVARVTGGRYINAIDGRDLERLFGDPQRLFSLTG